MGLHTAQVVLELARVRGGIVGDQQAAGSAASARRAPGRSGSWHGRRRETRGRTGPAARRGCRRPGPGRCRPALEAGGGEVGPGEGDLVRVQLERGDAAARRAAASASQMVEKPLEVPTSRIRVAAVARTRIQSRRPVSRVMLSMRRGRAVSRASLSSPNAARDSRKPSSTSSTGPSSGLAPNQARRRHVGQDESSRQQGAICHAAAGPPAHDRSSRLGAWGGRSRDVPRRCRRSSGRL